MTTPYPEDPTAVPEIASMNASQTGDQNDLVDLMVTYYQTLRPNWTPNAGHLETQLFETFALALTGEIVAVNNVPYAIAQQLMAYEGVFADDGTKAAARVQFTTTPSLNPITVPAGTRLRLTLDASVGEHVDLITEEPVTIYPDQGNTTGYASAVAEYPGGNANGIPAGTRLDIIDSMPLVETATLFTDLTGGRDPEDQEDFARRAEQARMSLSGTLGNPENFEAYAQRDPAVGRAHVLDRYDPLNPTATATGHVTIITMDHTGQPLTDAQMATLLTDLKDHALASLEIHVLPPTYTTVDLTVTIRARPGYDHDVVAQAATAAIRQYFSPLTWDWSPTVSAYMLVGVLSAVHGVSEVLNVPEAIPLAGSAPVPVPGTITVTVE